MARCSWTRLVVCGALAGLLLTPAFATEESAKEKPAEKKAAASDKADTKKPAQSGKAAQGSKAADAAECKPTATRVNTLEDVFGIRNWLRLQHRTTKPAAPVAQVAWRDATADAKPAPVKKD